MIELYGSDQCTACRQAANLLGQTPFEWKYVDVAKINFNGEIPRIVLENGQHIIGLGPINNWIKKEKERIGIPW